MKNFGPTAQLGWLSQALAELGLDAECLAGARKLAETGQQFHRRQYERQTLAWRRRQDALKALVDDPSGPLDEPVAAFVAEGPWVDVAPGQESPAAVAMIKEARRLIEGQVGSQIVGAGPVIFPMVKKKAGEVVAEVAQLPPIPEGVWTLSDAANELAKYRQHRETWGTLIAASQEFNLAHNIADLFRDYLGLSQDQLDGPPPWSLVYRNWRPVLSDHTWPLVRKELKLPYAIQHGFEPGLWEPSEIDVKLEDRTFGARLRNLGSAVLSGS